MLRGKVLIIDNQIEFRSIRVVLNESFGVIEATDPGEGMRFAELLLPDVVLLGTQQPGFDGYDVCRKLRGSRSTRHMQVMLIAAETSEEGRIRAFDLGADDFIALS